MYRTPQSMLIFGQLLSLLIIVPSYDRSVSHLASQSVARLFVILFNVFMGAYIY